MGNGGGAAAPCLIPVGVLPGGERLYVNWRETGHVLVAGEPGAGTDVVVTSLVAALAGRLDPERLALWTAAGAAGGHRLPDILADLPHRRRNADGPDAAARLLDELYGELQRRMRRVVPLGDAAAFSRQTRWSAGPDEPLVVLVMEELHGICADAALDQIGRYGPAVGLHVLGVSTRPGALTDDLLAAFDTRLVLAVGDEETSIRLLGDPCAADLAAGHTALRLDGRRPLVMQGLRTPESHLTDLVYLLRNPGQVASALEHAGRSEADNVEAADRSEVPAGDGATDRLEVPEPDGAGVFATHMNAESVTGPTPIPLRDTREPEAAPSGIAPGAPLDAALAEGRDEDREGTGEAIEAAMEPAPGTTGGGTDVEHPLPPEPREREGPLLQVRCFGGFHVLHDGRPLTSEIDGGSHHKSWALLAFLASHPNGTVTKDQLLAALWPESDEDSGGNCLGVTMYWLRRVLMRQVPGLAPTLVRTERTGMCRLDTAMVASDVHRFVECLEAARKLPTRQAVALLQEAHDLYEGDLLLGVPMRSYAWLHERESSGPTLVERYRDEFRRATLRLAEHYAGSGEAERAVPLCRRLLRDEPTDEEVARTLFHVYAQLGDLGALVREEQHLRQALRRAQLGELGDAVDETMPAAPTPERQTTAVFEQLRAELEQVEQVEQVSVPVAA